MSGINFAKKGLNQTIFSKKTVSVNRESNSAAMRGIMENKAISHVMDKASERRVFYDALKKRGMEAGSGGITKKVFKKVLGDIEHSGKFTRAEINNLGKELVGGSSSDRIIRDRTKVERRANSQVYDIPVKQVVRPVLNSRPANIARESGKILTFSQSNKAIRDAQDRNILTRSDAEASENTKYAFGHIPGHATSYNKHGDIDSIKSMLAEIQDNHKDKED